MRWISVLAPSERLARKVKSRLKAMQARPPSEARLSFLRELGDQLATPQNMAEASERIETLKMKQNQQGGAGPQSSNAPAGSRGIV